MTPAGIEPATFRFVAQQLSHCATSVPLDAVRNTKNNGHLVEEIRKRAVTLKKKNWKIELKWVKAQAGIYGNEIADRLPKEATQNYHVTYSRIPKSAIKKDTRKESIRKWQSQWEQRKERLLKNFFQV